MKTRNNVQKAILKSAAVIVSLVLISFTVNAQDFWKSLFENEAISQIAMAMTSNDSGSRNATESSTSTYDAVEAEEALKVEDWMMNDANFEAYNFAEETEAPMEVESWMTNDNVFNAPAASYTVEIESPMHVENWMVNDKVFEVENHLTSAVVIEKLEEPKMQLENWMINKNVWN